MRPTLALSTALACLLLGACSSSEPDRPTPPSETATTPTAPSTTPPPTTAPADPLSENTLPSSADLDDPTLARGREAYRIGMCATCHGAAGEGSLNGADLTDDTWLHCDGSVAGIREVLVTGVPRVKLKDPRRPLPMSPATFTVPETELDALADYVKSLSGG